MRYAVQRTHPIRSILLAMTAVLACAMPVFAQPATTSPGNTATPGSAGNHPAAITSSPLTGEAANLAQALLAQSPGLLGAAANADRSTPTAQPSAFSADNPFSLLSGVGEFIDRVGGSRAAPAPQPGSGAFDDNEAHWANQAGDLPRDQPNDQPEAADRGYSATISVMLIMTVLTLAPALIILCTSFTRIIIVLALLRQAIGTQSLPPSQIIVGLAFLLTLMIMSPTFEQINRDAIVPLTENQITEQEAWQAAREPIRQFMFAQIAHTGNWEDVYMILNYRGIDTSDPSKLTEDDVDMLTLMPAFIISELKTAFLMGFKLYLPFLVIDMVIASILISMGMMMLPPVLISLPFKLLLFVMVDGWRLVTGNLLNSFALAGGG